LFGLQTNAFRQQRVGGYMQDLVQINPNWQALGGVRFDTVEFEFDRIVTLLPAPPTALETTQTFNRVSPRGGLVYQPFADESLACYYSYSQSFSPPGGGSYFTAGPLSPVLGESHEAGIKAELLPGLSLTAAGYHTERENDTFFLRPALISQVGVVRTKGAELNLLGAITDYWSMIANYCYCDSEVFDASLGLAGTRARNVPFNTANLWTRYNFVDNECVTAGAAIGIVYVGERAASLLPSGVQLPGFSRWDAGLYYRRGAWNTAVYLENLFDIQYAQSSISELQVFQGAPFNGRAAVWYTF
jgi:iron complex outermembrane receptor protein